MKKIKAFTLAETLITLMVIGVVAALTIPSLMQSYRDSQFATAKKKAMSTISNGFKLMIANNDGVTDSLPLTQCGEDVACLSDVFHKSFQISMDKSKTHEGLVESYTKQGDSTEEAGFKWDDVPYIFTTNDGMTYGYLSGFDVVVDLNGSKAPNKICKDIYKFSFGGNTVTEKLVEDGVEKTLCEQLNDPIKKASEWYETACTDTHVSCKDGNTIYDNQGRDVVELYDTYCMINTFWDDVGRNYIPICNAFGYSQHCWEYDALCER